MCEIRKFVKKQEQQQQSDLLESVKIETYFHQVLCLIFFL